MKNYSVGDLYPLTLTGLAIGGEAVGRLEDLVVFVPFGAPGDQVEVRLCDVRKNYARGEINRLIENSPHRVSPPCPIFFKCGGCQLQQMTYKSQLEFKKQMVEEVLHHLGGLHGLLVDRIFEAPSPYYYRNKMQVVAACKPFLHSTKVAVPYFGLYARKSHRVVRMEECAIQHPLSNKLLATVRDVITRLQWEVFNQNTGEGYLRYLMTRVSSFSDEVILVIVSTTDKIPQMAEFVNIMTRKIPNLKGIIVNVNDKMTNTILGSYSRLIYGEDHLVEEIEGIKYRVSPHSFFQVNPAQTGRLFNVLEEYLEPSESDIVLDAYCGVGAISLWLARKVRTVIGIEEILQAKKDAFASAEMNGIGNLEFYVGQVEKILPEIYHKGNRLDKLVLDPPRKGCEEQVLDLIARMRVPRVVYVSCNPATFARDLAILKGKGYTVDHISLVDMFPQTYHVECVAKLTYHPTTFIRRVTMETPGDRETVSIPGIIPVRETAGMKTEPVRRSPSYHEKKQDEKEHRMAPRVSEKEEKPMKRKFFGTKVISKTSRRKLKEDGSAPETASLVKKRDFHRKAPETAPLESLDKIRREKLIKKAEETGDMKIIENVDQKKRRLKKAPDTGSLAGPKGRKGLLKAADTGKLHTPEIIKKKLLRKASDTGELDESGSKRKAPDTGELEDLAPAAVVSDSIEKKPKAAKKPKEKKPAKKTGGRGKSKKSAEPKTEKKPAKGKKTGRKSTAKKNKKKTVKKKKSDE